MAWIDDRIWCHPKFNNLTPSAFAAYVRAVAYSSGMGTGGHLDAATQKLVGATTRVRSELVTAGLWDPNGNADSVVIHDWDEHNGKRDERRRKDRERKREARHSSAGHVADSPQDAPQDMPRTGRGPAHVDGSEGSDGRTLPIPEPHSRDAGREGQAGDLERINPLDDLDFPAA